jgi:putative thioredoxin
MSVDVGEQDFEQRVIARSREIPVLVDFWAEWCGPCRVLGPALEAAVAAREGQVELVKVDTESNQMLASAFGIRGIPAVKAFRDGQVVEEFTGAIPPAEIERFLDRLLPSPADELAEAGNEESLRRALELDPRHTAARRELGRLLLRRGEAEQAAEVLGEASGDFIIDGLAARALLSAGMGGNGEAADPLARSFAAWDGDDPATALELLQEAVAREPDRERRDRLRRVMVAIFTELGAEHPLAREHRRRLAAALS